MYLLCLLENLTVFDFTRYKKLKWRLQQLRMRLRSEVAGSALYFILQICQLSTF